MPFLFMEYTMGVSNPYQIDSHIVDYYNEQMM